MGHLLAHNWPALPALPLTSEEARRIALSIEEAADKAEEDEYGD